MNEIITDCIRVDDDEGSFQQMVESMQRAIKNHVADEFRDTVRFDVELDHEYGYDYARLNMYFSRYETFAECKKREANEAKWQAIADERDRKELARLQEKFKEK